MKRDEAFMKFIKNGLRVCSFKNYIGEENSTIGGSAKNCVDKQLERDRNKIDIIFKRIQKTCQKESLQNV